MFCCSAIDAHAARMLKVNEEHPNMRVYEQVTHALEHPVAIIIRKS